MTNTDGEEKRRDITVALESELAQVSQSSVAGAAKLAEDRDIAAIMGQVMTVIIDANMRLRRTHRINGDDCHWWLATVDYLTRPENRQAQPTGQRRN